MATLNGTVKRLVTDKGFGFVQAQDGSEYFFHQSACSDVRFDDLREGQSLTFETGRGPKGPRAENLRVA
jgi:CspA family cold shock protein